MRVRALRISATAALVGLLWLTNAALAADDPLTSWNEGAAKQAIVDFVTAVTEEDGPDYVAPTDRIATFDNDGTLWSEQPMYVQLAFALDRVRALARDHPAWEEQEPFKSVLAGDLAAVAASGKKGLLELVATTHAGMTTDAFAEIVSDWIATARNPKTGMLSVTMIYQPMLELIDYLKANEFDVFIVSGGGISFMRPWTEETYGIAPPNVVGSSIKMTYEEQDDGPVIVRLPEIDFIDDGPGKPVGIEMHIGKRPIAAFGNSDGDFEMLEWTTTGPGRRLGLIVHHDDAEREFAYDRDSNVGHLDEALDAADAQGWVVVSMKNDWNTVFPQQ